MLFISNSALFTFFMASIATDSTPHTVYSIFDLSCNPPLCTTSPTPHLTKVTDGSLVRKGKELPIFLMRNVHSTG